MQASKEEKAIVYDAIDEWTSTGLIDTPLAQRLKDSIVTETSNRQQLASYFFIIAVSCALLAFGALFIDEKLLLKLQKTFLLQNMTIAVATALLAAACFWFARRQQERISAAGYELYLLPGTLAALISMVYLCKEIGNGRGYTFFLGCSVALLLSLCLIFRSRLLWTGFLLGAMGWFGAFSTVFSRDNLFLGMNYPVRFTFFGFLVLLLSWLQLRVKRITPYRQISYHAGLIITYTALWGLSVFGNYGYLDQWAAVRQTQVLGFAFVFAAATGIGLLYGIRKNDAAARDYSLLFLLLNLYTRYFEYFWNSINKGLFFLFLALSFWGVGRLLLRKQDEQQTS